MVQQLKHNDYDGQFAQLKWTFGYDTVGNITSIVDPKGNERRYTYDSLSRKRHVEDPNAGTLDLTYDDAGNLTQRINAVGQKVTAEYGQQSRLHRDAGVASGGKRSGEELRVRLRRRLGQLPELRRTSAGRWRG